MLFMVLSTNSLTEHLNESFFSISKSYMHVKGRVIMIKHKKYIRM